MPIMHALPPVEILSYLGAITMSEKVDAVQASMTKKERAREDRSAAIAVTAFPVFILLGTGLAWLFPSPFLPLSDYINQFLMVIMFGMGLTLTIPDFKEIARPPLPIMIIVSGEVGIWPLTAVIVGKVLGLTALSTAR